VAAGLRQALAILVAGTLLGFGGNALRSSPLPLSGSLDPPPAPEAGADLAGVSADDALALWEAGAFFLDIRAETEWERQRVAGALSVAADDFDSRYFDEVAAFGTDVPLFVYGSPEDSFAVKQVVVQLRDLGHADVAFVTGGLPELLAAGITGEGQAP
jgi:rhodanese-related sulfurtransferase